MKKALLILVVAVVVAAGIASWRSLEPRHTPAGQPPLESLNTQNLSDFKKAFNDSPSSVRLVLLLSPT